MSVPNGTPGAGGSESTAYDHLLVGQIAVPDDSPEAQLFAEGRSAESDDTAGDQSAAGNETSGDETLSDDTTSSDDAGEGSDQETQGAGEGDPDAAADAEDLAQYPERLRERFKSLNRDERRELYEYAESQVAPKLEQKYEDDRKAADDLKVKADADEAERARIRGTFGKFVGAEDIEIKDDDGNVVGLKPSHQQIERLLTTRNGEDILDEKYGMSRADALEWKDELEERRGVIEAVSSHFDDQAWGKVAMKLQAGLKAIEGIDPDAIVNGANGPDEVIARLHSTLSAQFERKLADQKDGYEKRIRLLSANGEALKGQAAAGTGKRLETGGMTGSPGGEMTLDEYRRLTPEQQGKLTPQQIDRFTQRLATARR